MRTFNVEFAEIAETALRRLSDRFGWEFPDNQVRARLRFTLSRDPSELGLERCPAWEGRSIFVSKVYAKIEIRILIEVTEDRVIVWSLSEGS